MSLRLLFLFFSFSNADDKRSCNTTSCLAECPQGWEVFENRCYLWVTNETRNGLSAERFCRKSGEGGHLASVTSKEVHEYMLDRVGETETKKVWIGATDAESEGVWKWEDGSPFNFQGWVHQPDGRTNENCAELYNTYENSYNHKGWNDLDCHSNMNFVCAKPAAPTTRTTIDSTISNTPEYSLGTIVLVSTSCSVIGMLVIVVVVFLICRHGKRFRVKSAVHENENPLYGMYYFPDGERIDYGIVEVEDENTYYEKSRK